MRSFLLSLFVVFYLMPVTSVAQCGPDSTLISMFVTVDAWGEENYWELVPSGNDCGVGTLYSGANEMVGCQGTPPEADGGYPDNSIFEVPSFCLPTGEVFDLIFVDSYGDGGPIFELYENGSFAHAYFGTEYGNTWSFEVGNSGLPAYDSPCGAQEIVPNGDGVAIDNSDCVAQSAEPRPQGLNCGLPGAWCEGNITNTAWAYFVAEAGVTYEITSCNEGGGFDTQLALYKANSCLGWESFELIAANDDMAGGCSVSNGYSSLFYASCLEAGEVYYIQIDGWEASIGSAVITVRTVEVENELQAIFNNISCPISKGEIPQSSILPYLTGSGSNFDCVWMGPGFFSIDQNIYEIGPGIYSLTATDACGVSHQASFEVTQPDLWNISTIEFGPTCEATSDGALALTVYGATPPYSFEWIGPFGFTSNEQDLSDISAGNYQITVTDNNECTSSAYIILEPENSFSFNLGNDTILCLNDNYLVVAPPGLFYVWQDQSINQFYNIDAETWGTGQHAVILTATTPDGCVYADDLVFTVQECTNQVLDWNESGWSLYPNPSAEVLNLEWSHSEKGVSVTLTDMQGRVVDQTFSSGSQKLVWNPTVASGTYQVIVESEGKRYFSRWTKCK